ncbi:Asparagine-rich protein (ARP protein) [Blastocladiella emersonii ATCC 22665]|nr:Asparagine-rich protein (ARP protein) [Blastocladiella emersonii ATCC 22665]
MHPGSPGSLASPSERSRISSLLGDDDGATTTSPATATATMALAVPTVAVTVSSPRGTTVTATGDDLARDFGGLHLAPVADAAQSSRVHPGLYYDHHSHHHDHDDDDCASRPSAVTDDTVSSSVHPDLDAAADDDLPEFLVILRIETTHDARHPGDPDDGIVDDIVVAMPSTFSSTVSSSAASSAKLVADQNASASSTTSAGSLASSASGSPTLATPAASNGTDLADSSLGHSLAASSDAAAAVSTVIVPCGPPPRTPTVPADQAEVLALAWCIYHTPTAAVVARHLFVTSPQATPVTVYTEARSGIAAKDVLDLPGLDAALVALDQSLAAHGLRLNGSAESQDQQSQQPQSPRFAFLTYDAFDLRLQLPTECRRKRVDLPPALAQPVYFSLVKEVSKWMRHHPESAHQLPSLALRDLCYYFSADAVQGVPVGSLSSTITAEFATNLPARPENAVARGGDAILAAGLLPSPLHRCEAMANLVTALRAYRYPDVLAAAIDCAAGFRQFADERSCVLHLSELPFATSAALLATAASGTASPPATAATSPTEADVLAWFRGYGLEPVALQMLVNRQRVPTGDAFATFATHDEAHAALAMNGRMLRVSGAAAAAGGLAPFGGTHAATPLDAAMIAVDASSPVVLVHAHANLVPFPNAAANPAAATSVSSLVPHSQQQQHGGNGGGTPMRVGDWLCPACRYHNFASRQSCHRCTTPNPANAVSSLGVPDYGGALGTSPGNGNGNGGFMLSSSPAAQRGNGFGGPASLLRGNSGGGAMARSYEPQQPQQQTQPQQQPTEWYCGNPICGARNAATQRMRCFHCGVPRHAPGLAALDAAAAAAGFQQHHHQQQQSARFPPAGASAGKPLAQGEPDSWNYGAGGDAGSYGSASGGAMMRGVQMQQQAQQRWIARHGSSTDVHAGGIPTEMAGSPYGPGSYGANNLKGGYAGSYGAQQQQQPTGRPGRSHSHSSGSTPHHHHHHQHHPNGGGGPSNMRPGDWICPNADCRFQNFASRAMCLRCGNPSPTPPTAMCPVPFRAGDWLCVACHAHNFASRINCVRCGCTKALSLAAAQGQPSAIAGRPPQPQQPQQRRPQQQQQYASSPSGAGAAQFGGGYHGGGGLGSSPGAMGFGMGGMGGMGMGGAPAPAPQAHFYPPSMLPPPAASHGGPM